MSVSSNLAVAIESRLAQITIANGFNTDLGLKTFRGRRRLDATHIPCAVLIEGIDRVTSEQRAAIPGRLQYKKSVQLAQRFTVEGHSTCDADHPNDVGHLMVSDIKKAIFNGDVSFGGLVKDIRYISKSISPREDGIDVVAGAVEIELEFVEDLTSP